MPLNGSMLDAPQLYRQLMTVQHSQSLGVAMERYLDGLLDGDQGTLTDSLPGRAGAPYD